MQRTSTASTRIGLGLIAALFAVNLYRAATQSFTTDEALTYLRFVFPPLAETWQHYDANNHVLNSLAARLSVGALGSGEFALRLPSLLAGLAYLAGAWVLARRVFRTGPLFLAALGLLALNPLVVDHLIACRGYGIALAGWLWGLLLLWDCLETGAGWRMQAGAVALALSVCANLAFLFPVAATALVFSALVIARRGWSGFWELADRLAIPAVTAGFVVLLLPLLSAGSASFYYGSKLLGGAVGELAEMSVFRERLGDLWIAEFVLPWARGLAALAMAAAVWTTVRAGRRRASRPGDLFLLLGGGTTAVALLAIVAAHRFAGMPYPENRTALYWIPLLSVMSLAAVQEIGWRPLTAVALAASALLSVRYAQQTRLDAFGEWQQDAGVKQLAAVLKREAGGSPVRICGPHAQRTTLAYYRVRMAMPEWKIEDAGKAAGPCDWEIFHVWDPADQPEAVYRDRRLALVRRTRQ